MNGKKTTIDVFLGMAVSKSSFLSVFCSDGASVRPISGVFRQLCKIKCFLSSR